MSLKRNFSRYLSFLNSILKHPKEIILFARYIVNENVFENDKHIKMAADWLLKAQDIGKDDGYSRGFYLQKSGWDKSYIETTGYIIPTMLSLYEYFNDEKYLNSAKKAGNWLLSIQLDSGAFSDIDNNIPLVFDTGQVLYGLIALHKSSEIEDDKKEQYKLAIKKASIWLCDVQDTDGSWQKYGYQNLAHTYYTRVGSVLYEAGVLLNEEFIKEKAQKHIQWVLSSQLENGFFDKLRFVSDEKPLLHAIVYVLEGLYHYYNLTGDKIVYASLMKNVEIFKKINLKKDLLLCSQYDNDFECINSQRCMTGLAQWANLTFMLYYHNGDEELLYCAKKTLYYLKSKQFKEGKDLKGTLPGSVPFWGVYAPFSAVNWGVKFFIDAMIQYSKFEEDLISQSNLWIGECFRFNKQVISSDFTTTGKRYLNVLDHYIKQVDSVLDIGSGEGKYIRYFKDRYPNKKIVGVDPVFYDGKDVFKGDAYEVGYKSQFDLIYTIETLQHVKYLDIALSNIVKKLNRDGYLIICDRNLFSLLGLLKPLYEVRGKWMYPYDSPFKEKWYSVKRWKKILAQNGFEVVDVETFTSNVGRSGWMSRYSVIVARRV